jgi:hypothetical protein
MGVAARGGNIEQKSVFIQKSEKRRKVRKPLQIKGICSGFTVLK